MTKMLEEAISKVRALPEKDQDAAAEALLAMTSPDGSRYHLSPEQAEEVCLAVEEAERGEIASDEEAAALFRKCGA